MRGIRLSPDLYNQLHAIATPMQKAKGAILFRAGQSPKGAYLVRRGHVRMTLAGDSKLYPARILGEGSVIGLPATFSGEPYSLTAEAANNCEVDFIARKKLLTLLRNDPAAGFHIVRVLSEEIFQMRQSARVKPAQHRVRTATH